MHTDSGMTGISLSGYMPYMTVASLEMSDEPFNFLSLQQKDYLILGDKLRLGISNCTY